MSRVLKTIESNVLRNTIITTPVKSPRKEFHGNKSAKKYRAADLLDAALKHERSGDKEAALAAYEDAAENISNNSKILAKIALLKSQISADIENLAMEKKKAFLENEKARCIATEINRFPASDERDYYEDDGGDVSMMTEESDTEGEAHDLSDIETIYSEYDPAKRADVLQQLQTKTVSALEYQLLDRLNKGDEEELLLLKKVGNVRASRILDLRDQCSGDPNACFKSLDQLEDIGMKPKEIKTFLKQNATFLLGL